ncbi:MAG TPA: potassium transporter TrkG, partial [Caldilineaceae bacterium]|nr:potassium transporter TrkG [Caldilineaceae bacterium]
MTVSTLLVTGVTLILSLAGEGAIFVEGFEVVSAFSNTGYSLNFTSSLDNWGRFLIAFTMFWGRLGPLTIVVALAQSEQPSLIRFPEEPVILG